MKQESIPCLFEIRAKGNREVDVLIYGDIGSSWSEESVTAAKFVRDLQNVEADTINVRLNSYGGAVSDALAIYNAIRRHPATTNTFVDGVAVSAASLVAMAGDTLTIAANGVMMIHAPWGVAVGNAPEMREMADVLDRYAKAMVSAYSTKSGKPADEVLAMLTDGKDHWYTAEEAKAAGFADVIAEAELIEASFDFRRFGDVPAAAAAFQRKEATMADNANTTAAQPTAASTTVAPAALTVVHNGRTAEQVAEIKAAFAPFMKQEGIAAEYTAILEKPDVTVAQARDRLLAKLGEGAQPANPAGHTVHMGEDARDKFRAAGVIAVMARAGTATAEQRKDLGANPYRGDTLLDLAKASLARINFNIGGMDKMAVVQAAFTQSTSDFPYILENAMHKSLLGAYATQPNTWRSFCGVTSVSDFRAAKRYRLGSIGNLVVVNENGEFKYKPIPDAERSTVQATTKGLIINVSRQMIVNDDMNAFVGLSAQLGMSAARSIEADVYASLDDNSGQGPTMADGGILFNTTAITSNGGHANRTAYATPTVALLDTLRQQMKSQKDPSQNDFLDLTPAVALCRPSLTSTVKVLNMAQYDPSEPGNSNTKAQLKPNVVAGIVNQIVDSGRITWDAVYLFADPQIAPVFMVSFLDGNEQPVLESQVGFEIDGMKTKVRHDWGVDVVDYRGAVALV